MVPSPVDDTRLLILDLDISGDTTVNFPCWETSFSDNGPIEIAELESVAGIREVGLPNSERRVSLCS